MKAKLWLVPALLLLSAFAQAQETFKVGYIRVMDDAQAMVAYEGEFYKNTAWTSSWLNSAPVPI